MGGNSGSLRKDDEVSLYRESRGRSEGSGVLSTAILLIIGLWIGCAVVRHYRHTLDRIDRLERAMNLVEVLTR